MEIATDKMGAAGSLVVAIVAHGIALGESWPFVTLSSFQERAATVKRLSGALYIGMNPVVKDADRLAWENYSVYSEDHSWIEEAHQYQKVRSSIWIEGLFSKYCFTNNPFCIRKLNFNVRYWDSMTLTTVLKFKPMIRILKFISFTATRYMIFNGTQLAKQRYRQEVIGIYLSGR